MKISDLGTRRGGGEFAGDAGRRRPAAAPSGSSLAWLLGWVLCLALPAAAGCQASPGLERFERSRRSMGTRVNIVFYATGEKAATEASEAAFGRIEQLVGILSDYDPSSELSQLSATAGQREAVPISDELYQVLAAAQRFSRRSGGAFDVTVGPIVELWRRAQRTGHLPNERRLEAALESVGHEHLTLDPTGPTATLEKPGMQLDLGGIAKGYIADEALQILRKHGVEQALIDAGGDVRAGAPPPDRDGWIVAVDPKIGGAASASSDSDGDGSSESDGEDDDPAETDDADPPSTPDRRYLQIAHAAVATSGDAYRYVEVDGRRYSHIVNPKTGIGLTRPIAVTAIAPDGMTADALASIVSVLGPDRGIAFTNETDGAAVIIVTRDEQGHLHTHESQRVSDLRFVDPAALSGSAEGGPERPTPRR